MVKTDAKALIARVKKAQSDKRKVSLYLSGGVYDAFKTACDKQGVSPSEVTEYMMQDFIESLSGSTAKSK